MNNEVWKDVKGYEGLYAISSEGRLKSFILGTRFIKLHPEGGGYLSCWLCKNGKRKRVKIHRLVAENFLEQIDGMHVNHINGIKTDNRLVNLEWVTPSQNNHHAVKLGLTVTGKNHHKAKLVLDLQTGIFYDCLTYGCKALNIKPGSELARNNNNRKSIRLKIV